MSPFFSAVEIEDVLSCDDVVLKDVLQYHQPPQRRLPPLLWVRIHADLREYLVTGGADGVQVYRWYHRQFQTVATERYLTDEMQRCVISLYVILHNLVSRHSYTLFSLSSLQLY